MRYFNTEAVLIGQKKEREIDSALLFLTSDNNLIEARDYSARKTGGHVFPLYSTGRVFFYKSGEFGRYNVTDSSLEVLRPLVTKSSSGYLFAPFLDLIKFFTPLGCDEIYDTVNIILDLFDQSFSPKKLFAWFSERSLSWFSNIKSYYSCPICGNPFMNEDIVSFNNDTNLISCSSCSISGFKVLPGMRRYINYMLSHSAKESASAQISDKALNRVLSFDEMRLKNISHTAFTNLRLIQS